jgi:predicted ATPase
MLEESTTPPTVEAQATDSVSRLSVLRERLRNELGEEAQVLIYLIPSFYKVLHDGSKRPDDNEPERSNLGHGVEIRNRFVFAMRRCVDIVCAVFGTFILVLDDLQ